MKKLLIYLMLVLISFSCTLQSVYELPFDKPQIVLNSILVANKNPEIYVSQTWGATDKIPEKPYIEDADVQLFENGLLVAKLNYKGKGIYKSSDFILKPLNSYVYKVNVPNIGQVQNLPVGIPDFPKIQSMSVKKQSTGLGDNFALLNINVLDNPAEINYYGINVKGYYKGNITSLTSNVLRPVELGDIPITRYNSDCIKQTIFNLTLGYDTKAYEFALLYSNVCFTNSEKTIGIVTPLLGYVMNNPNIGGESDAYYVTIGFLSKEYFEFAKSIKTIEGIDYAFTEPNPTYTNVMGGKGNVLASNTKAFIVKI